MTAAALIMAGGFVADATAEAPPLILQHLTTADGLPQGTVHAALQDSQGFIWLGTEDGLIRFDGHELFRYSYSRTNSGGIPGNFIQEVIEDAHHDLWIAVKDAGLARWNRATDTFTVYRHDGKHASSLSSDNVRALAVDRSGRIWVGTSDAGIDVLEPSTGHIEPLRHQPGEPETLIDNDVFALTVDSSGSLWAGTSRGLDRWDAVRHVFIHYGQERDASGQGGVEVSHVLEDRNGLLWVGTFDHGLLELDHQGRLIHAYRHEALQPGSLASDDVRDVLEDQAGHLWIGTTEGLDLLDRASGRIEHYRHDPADPESLRDSFILSLYEDHAGLVWIGTKSGGVSRWNPHSWELGGHRPEWLHDKLVTAFADAPAHRVWVASLGGGLAQFDAETGQVQDIDALLGRHAVLDDPRVMSLLQDRQEVLWIGTMAGGLVRLDHGKLQKIATRPGDPHGVSAEGIMTLYQARDGRIWIGTHGGGANILDPATGLVRQLPFASNTPGAVSAANVSSLAEDARGNFWIGTDGGGLNLARPDGTVVKVFRHDPNDPTTLPANTVYGVMVDAAQNVWVATDGGGLARVLGNPATPEAIHFRTVTREDGLSSDTIYGVLADTAGHVWMSGDAGLMRYDPATGAVKTYHRQHGLQGEEFDSGAYYRLQDGRLCFGGPGGFNLFDPARLSENREPPRLALTRVSVMGVPVSEGRPSWLLEQLSLDFRANVVSLDFGVLDFTSPQRNRLAYRMAGLTDSWIDLGNQQRITLTNLEPGDHVLEVRAANADSVWSATPLRFSIHRDPAPWRSSWAYAAYVLAIFALIAYRTRLQRLKFERMAGERQRLEAEVALRTRELRESNHQLEEAVQAKSRFLDRMSHELRTPMNGVLGMTELLARTALSGSQTRLVQTIRSSAHVLLQIVNDLLDLSKIRAGKVALEELPVDVVRILEECTALFTGAVESKGIELIVCPPAVDHRDLVGDPLRLRQILMNLVGNAVKFTSQGEIVVAADVEVLDTQRMLRLSVSDTGIGMDAATIAKIFNPFTQADESTTRRFGGTGLGLAICRELAELMGGQVGVDSRPRMGSTFRVSIPLKCGAGQAAAAAALPARRVRIVTRRPAWGESLSRYLASFGLETVPAADSGEDWVIVDVSAFGEYLKTAADTPHRLLVLATEAQVQAGELATITQPHQVILKPFRRDSLHEALACAAGIDVGPTDSAVASAVLTSPLEGHVLLVEDEPVNAAVAEGYLTSLGCTVVWVSKGAEAVARNATEHFDLILMDLSMPELDGFATTALIRAQPGERRIPIIALTAHSSSSYRQSCLQADMDDLLSKPCTLEQCESVLRRWLPSGSRKADPRAGVPPMPVPATPARDDSALARIDDLAVARLRTLRGSGHSDLYSKLVDLFSTGSQETMQQMQTALQAGDLPTAAALCHKFASSAANVAAPSFATSVRELERLCLAADKTAAATLFERLRSALPALLAQLQQYRLPVSA